MGKHLTHLPKVKDFPEQNLQLLTLNVSSFHNITEHVRTHLRICVHRNHQWNKRNTLEIPVFVYL